MKARIEVVNQYGNISYYPQVYINNTWIYIGHTTLDYINPIECKSDSPVIEHKIAVFTELCARNIIKSYIKQYDSKSISYINI